MATVVSFLLFSILTSILNLENVSGQRHCPAPKPCTCGDMNNVITCRGFGLTTVPNFQKSNETWDLYLDMNNISSIPSRSFPNIKIEYLQLDNNNITSIDNDAFGGLETVLRSLHLGNNRLTVLPEALTSLRNITYLDVKGNLLPTLATDIMKTISRSLYTIHFGSPEMTSWPSGVNSLKCFELGIYNVPFEYIPESTFDEMTTVSWIYIVHTKLKRLPDSLHNLKGLFFLSLDSNENLLLNGISKPSFQGLSKINWFQISNSKITSLPDIFKEITGLSQFEVFSTPIDDFSNAMLPDVSNITILTLNDTRISKIPSAIRKMKSMNVLSMNFNNITAIADDDLAGLGKMAYISISNCPLQTVSDGALKTFSSLQYIAFDNTKLTTIPKAINGVQFDIISLFNCPIVCTCQGLGWMKHWSRSSAIGINGKCVNLGNSDLATYVRQEVPKCPN